MKALVLASLALVVVLACQSVQQKSDLSEQERKEELRSNMQELSTTVAELLPLTFSSSAFSEAKNKSKIAGLIEKMDGLAHDIEDSSDEPSFKDPSLQVMAGGFEEEMELTKDAFESGHTDYARYKMRDALSYCIQCHTQSSEGANFMALDLGSQIESMSLLSQAEFFAATRQFSRALDSYKALLSGKGELSPLEWEKASLHALAIAVRYLRSPEQALEIVSIISKDKSTPYYVRKDTRIWKQDLTDWQNNWAKEQKYKDEELVTKAKSILGESAKEGTMAPSENSSVIDLLRSSALLHQYLSKPRDDRKTSEALLYLGKSYAGVRQFNLSNLEERFYERCIETSPHTGIAQECFDRYKEKILIGFSGSGGLVLPPDVERRMKRYELQAAVEKQ